MRVAVAAAVLEVFHQARRRIAQAQRYRAGAVLLHERARRVVGGVDRVGLRRHREIDHCLRQRELPLRRAEPLVGLGRIERQTQCARIRQANVFAGHSHHAACRIARVDAAVDHPHEPIERRVGVGAANRLVQRRDRVVELLAALVVAAQLLAERSLELRLVDLRDAACHVDQVLVGVEQAPRVAVGVGDEALCRGVGHRRRGEQRAGSFQQLRQVVVTEALQHMHRRARQQGRVHLERRVLGGCADEGEQPRLDMREERVLLALVEAVYFIDEDHRAPPARLRRERALDRFANVLHAAEHGRDGDELRIERVGHQPRQRRLAGARRAPQDHRMQAA